MSGPDDPGSDDWGFPEVDPAGPASTQLPAPEQEPEQVFDTHSDAWWRAQAQAQRAAADSEPTVPPAAALPPPPVTLPPAPATPPPPLFTSPPELIEATVLLPDPQAPLANPLDSTWLPPGMADVPQPLESSIPSEPEPVPEPPAAFEPSFAAPPAAAPPTAVPPVTLPLAVDPPPAPEPAERAVPPYEPAPAVVPSFDDQPRERDVPVPGRVGPKQAIGGALLAVTGVALAIGALWLANDNSDDNGSPAVVQTRPTPSLAPSVSPSAQPSAASPAPVVSPAASPFATASAPAAIVPVSVLNNSKIKGLARTAAAKFQAGGWPVPVQGNYRGGTIAQTTVYYAPGQVASAQRFAQQFGIGRVAPRFAGLPTQGMTVIVTRDFR